MQAKRSSYRHLISIIWLISIPFLFQFTLSLSSSPPLPQRFLVSCQNIARIQRPLSMVYSSTSGGIQIRDKTLIGFFLPLPMAHLSMFQEMKTRLWPAGRFSLPYPFALILSFPSPSPPFLFPPLPSPKGLSPWSVLIQFWLQLPLPMGHLSTSRWI